MRCWASPHSLTMFVLVLAIGLVVADAIVVGRTSRAARGERGTPRAAISPCRGTAHPRDLPCLMPCSCHWDHTPDERRSPQFALPSRSPWPCRRQCPHASPALAPPSPRAESHAVPAVQLCLHRPPWLRALVSALTLGHRARRLPRPRGVHVHLFQVLPRARSRRGPVLLIVSIRTRRRGRSNRPVGSRRGTRSMTRRASAASSSSSVHFRTNHRNPKWRNCLI